MAQKFRTNTIKYIVILDSVDMGLLGHPVVFTIDTGNNSLNDAHGSYLFRINSSWRG